MDRSLKVVCPGCGGIGVKKNGHNRHGRQGYKCKGCLRQFTFPPARRISGEMKAVVRSLLIDKVPVDVIARATGVSAASVYAYKRGGVRLILFPESGGAGTDGPSSPGSDKEGDGND